MPEDRTKRRLAAIMVADVVGFSRMMEADEAGTLARLKTFRSDFLDRKIAQYGGRVFKQTGDGALVEFGSAVDAVQCAVELQRGAKQRNLDVPQDRQLILRIGIDLGDVMVEGDDIYGSGVNVAARLERLCDPGLVYLSGSVFDQVAGRLDVDFDALGRRQVKNISEPVRVYRARGTSGAAMADGREAVAIPLPDKPSIAVLPFVNLSGDPDQEYFADGMTEDIITGLSRFHTLFVIARTSTFSYKGHTPDIAKVARDLGVRYILEGSVRKGGNRIRITAQLIEARTRAHLWAERFDRDLEDIFLVQDEVTEAIVAAIAPEISNAERERAQRRPPDSLDAWGLYQQGLVAYRSTTGEGLDRAIALFDRVNQLDPTFAPAFAWAASARVRSVLLFPPEDATDRLRQAQDKALTAVTLDSRDATCLWADSYVQNMLGNHEIAIARAKEATEANPSDAIARYCLGMALGCAGRLEEALTHVDHAMRLSPHDAGIAGYQTYRSFILFDLERYDEALEWARRASRNPNPLAISLEVATASLVRLGRSDDAKAALGALLAHTPGASLARLDARPWIGRPEAKGRYLEAMRAAGLPE